MRSYFFYVLCFFSINSALAQGLLNRSTLTPEIKERLSGGQKLNESQLAELFKGEVLSQVRVETKQNVQELNLWVSGMHPQNCQKALRKISHYEGYPKFLSFFKSSEYNDSTQRWQVKMDHVLMPFPMYLNFKIPRIKSEGTYPFTFETGFLSGLLGVVTAQEIDQRCQLTLKADWKGPKSQIPDIVFSTFVQTLAEMGLSHLIRSTML